MIVDVLFKICARAVIATLIFAAATLSPAFAEGRFSGRMFVSDTPNGRPFLLLTLFDTGSQVSGEGHVLGNVLPEIGAGRVEVADGRSDGNSLHLNLDIYAFGASQTLFATLVFNESNGPFQPATLIVRDRPRQVFVARNTPAPAPPRPPAADAAACGKLNAFMDRLRAFGTDEALGLRAILARHGLDQSGRGTRARCHAALADMRQQVPRIEREFGADSPQCRRFLDLESRLVAALQRRGIYESGQLDAILRDNRLPGVDTPAPDAAYTSPRCRRANGAMEAYLAGLTRPQGHTGAPDNTSPARIPPARHFAAEALRDLNDDDVWRPGNGGNALSFWSHNNSGMAWESGPNNARSIWYWNPRGGLRPRGVERGTLLFEGRRTGSRMKGVARIYTANCGVYPYAVEGPITNGDTRVTMRGAAPRVTNRCEVVGTFEDTLIFDFVAKEPTFAVQPGYENEPPPDAPGIGVYATRFRIAGVRDNDVLNMRATPSANARKVGQIPFNASGIIVMRGCAPEVDSLAWSRMSYSDRVRTLASRWCHVRYEGIEGWVSGNFLRPR